MHTAHKITIEFGLLAIPARLGVVVPKSDDTLFHQVHAGECGGQIRQKRECELCRQPVEYAQVGKGITVPGTDQLVQISKEELEALQDWEAKTLRLEQFVPAGQVDPLLATTTYRVSPGHDAKGRAPAMRAAGLLLAAMVQGGLAGIGRFGNSLAMLEVRDGQFLVTKLAWPAVLRGADQDTVIDAEPRPQELKMATQLLKSMTGDWRPDEHVDTHREAVMELVAAKAAGTVPAPTRAGQTVAGDMMAVLQASIDEVKAQRAANTTPKAAPARARRKAG